MGGQLMATLEVKKEIPIFPASGGSSPQPGSLGNRFWRFAFLALMVLECSALWVYPYFPSQDGPSHLHNASVLASYGTEVIYRQYYRRTPLQPAGNMVTQ